MEMDNHMSDKDESCYDNAEAAFSDDEEDLNSKGEGCSPDGSGCVGPGGPAGRRSLCPLPSVSGVCPRGFGRHARVQGPVLGPEREERRGHGRGPGGRTSRGTLGAPSTGQQLLSCTPASRKEERVPLPPHQGDGGGGAGRHHPLPRPAGRVPEGQGAPAAEGQVRAAPRRRCSGGPRACAPGVGAVRGASAASLGGCGLRVGAPGFQGEEALKSETEWWGLPALWASAPSPAAPEPPHAVRECAVHALRCHLRP